MQPGSSLAGWQIGLCEGQRILPHLAIMTADSALRETNWWSHRDATSATAAGAAKSKLQAKWHYFSSLYDNSVNIFDKYVLDISLKIWSHGKMVWEIHQNIMIISECVRERIMGNSYFLLCIFVDLPVFYNQLVLFYNKEIHFLKTLLPTRKKTSCPGRAIVSTIVSDTFREWSGETWLFSWGARCYWGHLPSSVNGVQHLGRLIWIWQCFQL